MKLVSIPANPVPDDAVTGMLKTPDGVSLRFARFAPPAGRRGSVCIFPGRTEWIEIKKIAQAGIATGAGAVEMLSWANRNANYRP